MQEKNKPNLLFILVDQLRATSLPLYGEKQIETPHIDQFAEEGTLFSQAISSCPLCTPYRSMLLTGQYPQETGHVVNFMNTRHDEISIADTFKRSGYQTGYIGKWHLHSGTFPHYNGPDYIPEGRDRLGFDYWRAYNYHTTFFDGSIGYKDWEIEHWKGYETNGLCDYVDDFLEQNTNSPFCLFLSPHQPHGTNTPIGSPKFAPEEYYDRLPQNLDLPDNVSEEQREATYINYRHYLAMICAIDDMVGRVMSKLKSLSLDENTIVVFTSDHGTQMGSHNQDPWRKRMPYEETIHVPLIVRWPKGELKPLNDSLVSPVDYLPTLCGLCGIQSPNNLKGYDQSKNWVNGTNSEQEAILTMNFTHSRGVGKEKSPDYLRTGSEWRGVRTHEYHYIKWIDGEEELYQIKIDPQQNNNLIQNENHQKALNLLKQKLNVLMNNINDKLEPCTNYKEWFDSNRRIIKNINGPLSHPETEPDWSVFN